MSAPKPKYLAAFEKMAAEGKDLYQLQGEFIIVEEFGEEEVKSAGGIIMTASKKNADGFGQNRPTLVRVVAVGEGYYDEETKEDLPLNVKPGDIILVGGQSVKWLSYFGPIISSEGARIGISSAAEVQLKFNGQEGYEQVFQLLESASNGKL